MRASARAACLSARKTRWLKYTCTLEEVYEEYYALKYAGQWSAQSDARYSGAADYSFDESTGELTLSDELTSIDAGGSHLWKVYRSSYYVEGVDTCDLVEIYYSGSILYEVGYNIVGPQQRSTGESAYIRGYYLTSVTSPKGAYPETENGYVYVAEFTADGINYTVMQYAGEYYCYAQLSDVGSVPGTVSVYKWRRYAAVTSVETTETSESNTLEFLEGIDDFCWLSTPVPLEDGTFAGTLTTPHAYYHYYISQKNGYEVEEPVGDYVHTFEDDTVAYHVSDIEVYGDEITYRIYTDRKYTAQVVNSKGIYIEEVTSTSKSAYPENGIQDGYWYYRIT